MLNMHHQVMVGRQDIDERTGPDPGSLYGKADVGWRRCRFSTLIKQCVAKAKYGRKR